MYPNDKQPIHSNARMQMQMRGERNEIESEHRSI